MNRFELGLGVGALSERIDDVWLKSNSEPAHAGYAIMFMKERIEEKYMLGFHKNIGEWIMYAELTHTNAGVFVSLLVSWLVPGGSDGFEY